MTLTCIANFWYPNSLRFFNSRDIITFRSTRFQPTQICMSLRLANVYGNAPTNSPPWKGGGGGVDLRTSRRAAERVLRYSLLK